MAPAIYPVGTWLLGSMVYDCHQCARVTGYNKKQTVMHLYTAPHQFSSVTERKARWSEKNKCWRYKTDGRWYVSLRSDRLTALEQKILTFLEFHKEPTLRDVYDATVMDFDMLQHALRPLMAEGKVEWVNQEDESNWRKQSAKIRLIQ
jgi:hypothetical protein